MLPPFFRSAHWFSGCLILTCYLLFAVAHAAVPAEKTYAEIIESIRLTAEQAAASDSSFANSRRVSAIAQLERILFASSEGLSGAERNQMQELRLTLLDLQPLEAPADLANQGSTGSIAGRVFRRSDGAGAADAAVLRYSFPEGTFLGSVAVDGAGRYLFDSVTAGEYRLLAVSDSGVETLYDGVPCSGGLGQGCVLSDGTSVFVAEGEEVVDINFELPGFATISGNISDANTGLPVSNASITLPFEAGANSTFTDSNGDFVLQGVRPGDFWVRASADGHKARYFGAAASCDERSGDSNCESTGSLISIAVEEVRNDVDIALTSFGSLNGTLTESVTGFPVEGAQVLFISTATGQSVWSATTDAEGTWSSGPLPDLTYVIAISSAQTPTFLFPDAICVADSTSCDLSQGQAVFVPLATAQFGLDAVAPLGASVEGRVVGSDGLPRSARITLYADSGTAIRSENANSSGNYRFSGLPPGSYRLVATTSGFHQFLRGEIYPNQPCDFGAVSCDDIAGAAPISVAAGAQITGIDFELQVVARYRGFVEEAQGGDAAFAEVFFRDVSGAVMAQTSSNSDGLYELRPPIGGPFFLIASANSGSQPETVFPNTICLPQSQCDFSSGTPFNVPATGEFENPPIAIQRLGRLNVSVSDPGGDTFPAAVRVFDSDGALQAIQFRTNGEFVFRDLLPGDYYVATDTLTHIDELYDGFDCQGGCDPRTGTPISISPNSEVSIAIELANESSFGVTAADAVLGSSLPADAEILDVAGNLIESFRLIGDVENFLPAAPGDYRVRVVPLFAAADRYFIQYFNGVDCAADCQGPLGQVISLGAQQQVELNFAMNPKRVLRGRVISAETGLGIDRARVTLISESGSRVGVQANQDGEWAYVLPSPGRFRVRTETRGFVDLAFPDLPCNDCADDVGQLFDLNEEGAIDGINFSLSPSPTISGRVIEAATAREVRRPQLEIYDIAGQQLPLGIDTNVDGTFEVFDVQPGTYFLTATAPGFETALWSGLPCDPGCDVVSGSPIVVNDQSIRDVDFDLRRLGGIAGELREAETLVLAKQVTVEVFTLDGNLVKTSSSGGGGFLVNDLASGTYKLKFSSESYVDMLLGGEVCEGPGAVDCDTQTGQTVQVSVGTTTDTGTTLLTPFGRIRGSVTDSTDGSALRSIGVELWNDLGGLLVSTQANTAGDYEFNGLEPGNYYVVTRTNELSREYIDELFDDIPCIDGFLISCGPQSTTPLVITDKEAIEDINFALSPLPSVVVNLLDGGSGQALIGTVDVLDPAGGVIRRGGSNSAGPAAIRIPPGDFYIKATALGYEAVLWPNVACPDDVCNLLQGELLTVSPGQSRELTIPLFRRLGINGSVENASDDLPLSGVAIDIWDRDESLVISTSTNSSGSFAVPLSRGDYFVSTDNAQGFIDLIFPDVECRAGPPISGQCSFASALPVTVDGARPLILEFQLRADDLIFRAGFEP